MTPIFVPLFRDFFAKGKPQKLKNKAFKLCTIYDVFDCFCKRSRLKNIKNMKSLRYLFPIESQLD